MDETNEANESSSSEDEKTTSTQRYRLIVKNLPKHCGAKQFRDILKKLKILNAKKLRSTKTKHPVGFVSFDKCDDFQHALKVLNNAPSVKGYKLIAEEADAQIVYSEMTNNDTNNTSTAPKPIPTVADMLLAVEPYSGIPYEKQLQMKQEESMNIALKMEKEMKACGIHLGDLKAIVKPIRPSPVVVEWRNKCELTIGYDVETNTVPVVGFTCGRLPGNRPSVFPVDECKIMPLSMRRLCKEFQQMLTKQQFRVFDDVQKTGMWKMLTIRTFDMDTMIIATVHLKDPEDANAKVVKDILLNTFGNCEDTDGGARRDAERGFRVTSIYVAYQLMPGDTPIYEHIYGAPYIYATLFTQRFRISPQSFFQPNVAAAEVLYSTIHNAIKTSEQQQKRDKSNGTLLLDICCGAGTIGIGLASTVTAVVGVEICEQAIKDARENALINGRSNKCRFVCGPAEDTFRSLIYHIPNANTAQSLDDWTCIGIADPPRAGMHSKLIQGLRKVETLRTLVYSSCDPKAATRNFVELCRPISNKYLGTPFKLVEITPVDMFPQTRHFEWELLFQR